MNDTIVSTASSVSNTSMRVLGGVNRLRRSFGKITEVADLPNLIEVQKASYDGFLQFGASAEERKDGGLWEALTSVFPIKDFSEKSQLEFVDYEFEEPKYDTEECMQRGITYAAPLKVTLRLVVWDIDEDTGARSIRDIKEQDVYMGDMPLMTGKGTFIVNGTERVIVSQMHRSPGVFFDHDRGKTHASGKYLYSARVIPYRGSWLDFEFDAKDVVYVRIDRRRKLPVTTMLMALDSAETAARRAELAELGEALPLEEVRGMSPEEILETFSDFDTFTREAEGWSTPLDPDKLRGVKLTADLRDAATGEVLAKVGTKVTARALKRIEEAGTTRQLLDEEELLGRYIAYDLVNLETGFIYAEAGAELTADLLEMLGGAEVNELDILAIDMINVGPYIRSTLNLDKNMEREDALNDIYRVMRPGEPPTPESADAMFKSLFFDSERYDLSAVGRVKMNARLDLEAPDTMRVLRREDVLAIVKTLVGLKDGRGDIDDIDHLGNRRVRSVGELLENQYRVGLLRMERATRERMSAVEVDAVMPQDLINAKPAAAAVREFFGSSQLSQFMDQTNPLSEITHKRRLSALGPGGLTRERAGFEVRDVHPTHYGRICPIETPEGPNIGLINSLATFARINQYGFIESPYRKVVDQVVTDEVVYMSAMEEGKYAVAQANLLLTADNRFVDDLVSTRKAGNPQLLPREQVEYMDVSPKQLVSVAAALIPFLENDDANRALMGSNMQRQAVPLLQSDAPFVGTGMEVHVARDSGAAVTARRGGVVDQLDAQRIVIRANEDEAAGDTGVDIYNLQKFQRSNQSTCITQKPLVRVGQRVGRGDIIADGPSTDLGELALGRNALVAFMPWNGYNFEDSIVISERIVRDDVFTSIHIEEFEVMARDTKLGQEEITRDIPNVGEEALRSLDEAGIVYVGAEIKPGDILVGKVTPKGESPMTPEEKLLRAIFGEKASDVRDTSLKVPPGATGTVVEVRVFSRRGVEKDERARQIDQHEIERLAKDRDDERGILTRSYNARMHELMLGQIVTKGVDNCRAGMELDASVLEALTSGDVRRLVVADDKVMAEIEMLTQRFDAGVKALNERFDSKLEKLERGDELPPGVMKMVKVFIAIKRKLQPGDKMAGRHGNKGVVSRIVPIEDMPHLEDGRPVDVVLNPLGVPSRMNVGQILETHLGWACAGLGRQIGDILDSFPQGTAEPSDLRVKLHEVYGDGYQDVLDGMDDDHLVDMAHNLRKGVPIATPVFDGAREDDIRQKLREAGLAESGQSTLINGRTGEPFDRQVTVGYIYMLKLHHLVDDKIHARSIGPYSLVTQQPLGGKAQFGGQRFGEMEVWALQAYGAAYTLQEMLTVKSDDVAGRTKVYEAIVRGDDTFEAGIPESFNVLIKELRSLGLNVELLEERT
jgi:DNA-directed RNA polymerase subunit beta